ncbi:hypothetical protein NGB58_25140 [Escherichia coli]|nr:hypothetical protein [Escherichia coli]
MKAQTIRKTLIATIIPFLVSAGAYAEDVTSHDTDYVVEKVTVSDELGLKIKEAEHPAKVKANLQTGEPVYAAQLQNTGVGDFLTEQTMIRVGAGYVDFEGGGHIFGSMVNDPTGNNRIYVSTDQQEWKYSCDAKEHCGFEYTKELKSKETSSALNLKSAFDQVLMPGVYQIALIAHYHAK